MQLRAERDVEAEVAAGSIRGMAPQDQVAVPSRQKWCGSDGSGVVGLRGSDGHHGVDIALPCGAAEDVLDLSRLIAAQREAGQVVALEPHVAAYGGGAARGVGQWCRQGGQRKPGMPGEG